MCFSDELTELKQYLTEARTENQVLSEHCRELEEKLAASEHELAQLRSRHAELMMQADRGIEELAQMELAAANLLRGSTAEAENTELLKTIGAIRKKILLFDERLRRYGEMVSSMMDACHPSETLRGECEGKFAETLSLADECLKLFPEADKQEKAAVTCSLVAADKVSRMVVIDQGSLTGVEPGVRFRLARDEETLAIVKVVVSRLDFSVAILEEGDFKTLVPGLFLQRVKNL